MQAGREQDDGDDEGGGEKRARPERVFRDVRPFEVNDGEHHGDDRRSRPAADERADERDEGERRRRDEAGEEFASLRRGHPDAAGGPLAQALPLPP
ncbi:MAG: hypothetical protein WDM84_01955 [Bauldia sp.]